MYSLVKAQPIRVRHLGINVRAGKQDVDSCKLILCDTIMTCKNFSVCPFLLSKFSKRKKIFVFVTFFYSDLAKIFSGAMLGSKKNWGPIGSAV